MILVPKTACNRPPHPPHGPAEQQIWTYRYADQKRETQNRLEAPVALRVTTGPNSARLTWERPKGVAPARYVISRGFRVVPWSAALNRIGTVKASELRFEDRDLKPGEVYHYTVHAEDAAGRPGPNSNRARTQTRCVEDLVVSVLDAGEVELTWTAAQGNDNVGYYVERAVVEVYSDDQLTRLKKSIAPLADPSIGAVHRIGDFQRLTSSPIPKSRYLDKVDLTKPRLIEGEPLQKKRFGKEDVDPAGKPYRWAVFAYRIRTVNALGAESGPSPYFLTIPSAPQFVFSRERSGVCDLKWPRTRKGT